MLDKMGLSLMSWWRRMELGLGHSWYTRSSASTCSFVYRTYFPEASIAWSFQDSAAHTPKIHSPQLPTLTKTPPTLPSPHSTPNLPTSPHSLPSRSEHPTPILASSNSTQQRAPPPHMSYDHLLRAPPDSSWGSSPRSRHLQFPFVPPPPTRHPNPPSFFLAHHKPVSPPATH